jgi:hypothetical protein
MKIIYMTIALPDLSLLTVNTVTHSYAACGLLVVVFKAVQIFFASSCAKLHIQNSGWTEFIKQEHKHYFILDSDQILLDFLLHFSFVILLFVNLFSCEAVQTLSKMHAHEFFWFWNKRKSASDRLRTVVNNFTVTFNSHIKWIPGYTLYTLYSSEHCAFCSL